MIKIRNWMHDSFLTEIEGGAWEGHYLCFKGSREFVFQEEPSWSHSRSNLLNDVVHHIICVIQSCLFNYLFNFFLYKASKAVTMHSFPAWAFEWLWQTFAVNSSEFAVIIKLCNSPRCIRFCKMTWFVLNWKEITVFVPHAVQNNK